MALTMKLRPINILGTGPGFALKVQLGNGGYYDRLSWKESFILIAGQGIYCDGKYVKKTRGIVTKYTYRIEVLNTSDGFINDMVGKNQKMFQSALKTCQKRRRGGL